MKTKKAKKTKRLYKKHLNRIDKKKYMLDENYKYQYIVPCDKTAFTSV